MTQLNTSSSSSGALQAIGLPDSPLPGQTRLHHCVASPCCVTVINRPAASNCGLFTVTLGVVTARFWGMLSVPLTVELGHTAHRLRTGDNVLGQWMPTTW